MFRISCLFAIVCLPKLGSAQTCELGWDTSIGTPGFYLGEGHLAGVYAMLVHDDGEGDGLYAAGAFISAGGVAAGSIARWDGAIWTSLGEGLDVDHSVPYFTNAKVRALATFDDGNGPALYAGGSFTLAGGMSAMNIARWKDGAWSELGTGLGSGVNALAVFDDGSGPALYAGGNFYHGNAPYIARWDGAFWTPLGSGLDGAVNSLAVYDDGSGPALFAGGSFGSGAASKGLAKWNGQEWVQIRGGQPRIKLVRIPGCTDGSKFPCWAFDHPTVQAMAVFDNGTADTLVIGGSFSAIRNSAIYDFAQWNGIKWFALNSGVQLTVIESLGVHDDGSGAAIYAGGSIYPIYGPGVTRWNGRRWEVLGAGLIGNAYSFASFDDGSGKALYVGGTFELAGGMPSKNIARWKCMD